MVFPKDSAHFPFGFLIASAILKVEVKFNAFIIKGAVCFPISEEFI
jgi:hypothetical protein